MIKTNDLNKKENVEKTQANGKALLPIAVFLGLFIGSGIISRNFYLMPTIVAFLIALVVAFIQNPSLSFTKKVSLCAKGIGDENIITMCLIFLAAGGFSGTCAASGGVESTVNLGLSLIPGEFAVVGLFIIGCFISLSMGTSVGTIVALGPIAVGVGEATGFSMALCLGAVVSGAMFGDNLSMISDTTIAAVRTQGCEMSDKFKMNFKIVFPAAVISAIIYFVITLGSSSNIHLEDYNIIQVIPYLVVLVGAAIGVNVFIVLMAGTILSLIAGLITGTITIATIFTSIGEGVSNMYDITCITIVVAAIASLVKAYGGIDAILNFIHKKTRTKKGAQISIALLVLGVDIATANNTIAIVLSGPIAKEIGMEYNIDKRRIASLLDIFASVGQGLIPYGAQLLYAAAAAKISTYEIIPYTFYPMLMLVSAIIFIIFVKNKEEAPV